MDDILADSARVSPRTIILVHGTWGRGFLPKISDLRRRYVFRGGKRWFEDGSQFRKRLDKALEDASLNWTIRKFDWSGANSVHARDCAARKLSDQLKEIDATAIIIAHSHGGNVAVRALEYLGSNVDRVAVVTLATPFLRVFARKFGLTVLASLSIFFLLWIGIGGILIVISIAGLDAVSPASLSARNLWPLLGGVVGAMGVGALISWVLINFFSDTRRASAIAKMAACDTKGLRMLVIRGIDDEASLSLAAGSIGSRLSYLMLVGLLPVACWAILGSMIAGAAIPILAPSESLLGPVIAISAASAGIFLLLPGVFKSVFGREFLLNGLTCDIAADSVPDTLYGVQAITLPLTEEAPNAGSTDRTDKVLLKNWADSILRLQHGIYNHPECVKAIVEWLRHVT
jgi:hypothetical protein